MESLWQDMKYGARMLVKNPGFTLLVVLTLALGVGANTAIFSVLDRALVRKLPVEEPGRLVNVESLSTLGPNTSFSHPFYAELRDNNQVLSGLLAYSETPLSLSSGGQSERVNGMVVSGNFFDVLGVTPALGRAFLPEEDRTPGAHPVVVVSHGLWRRRFGADPAVVGKEVRINKYNFTVVGVAPAEFRGPVNGSPVDVYVPMMMEEQAMPTWLGAFNNWGMTWLNIMGRLKPGMSRDQAQANLTALARQSATLHRENPYTEMLLRDGSRGETEASQNLETSLLLLMGVVALVLLIACANVANLLLARATKRRREIAVRLAVGASRWQLMRQLLTESIMLSALGGLLGLLVAVWLRDALLNFGAPGGTFAALANEAHLDMRVLGFNLLLSVLTGIIFGLAPAFRTVKVELIGALKDDGSATGPERKRVSLRNLLVAGQVGLSLVVLVCAGLCLRSLLNLRSIATGFEPARVLVASIDLSLNGYAEAQGREFYSQLLERTLALPGVEAASLARIVPLTNSGMRHSVDIEGYTPPPGRRSVNLSFNVVGPGYFSLMKMKMAGGREFTSQDDAGALKTVIINETVARTYWPGRDPLGKHITLSAIGGQPAQSLEIIGVVKDGKYRSLTETVPPTMFLPLWQHYRPDLALHLRSAMDPASLAAAVRREVQALDPNLPVFRIRTLAEQMNNSLETERMAATLLVAFGALALLLASLGIYGVMAYRVSQRTHEIGIRMALGAQARDVFRMVLEHGMALVAAGIALGIAGAIAATHLLWSFLYGVSPVDPGTFVAVAVLLTGVALCACFIPARRASKMDPMVALRYE